jgi:hypothetical protein
MMALVVVHIAAVVAASWLHHENLIGTMISGRKAGAPQDGVARAWRGVAALMLAAVLGFWWLQWRDAPAASSVGPAAAAAAKHERHRD